MNNSISSVSTASRRPGGRYMGRAQGQPRNASPARDGDWAREQSTYKQRLLHLKSQVDTSTPESAAFARPVRAAPRSDQVARAAQIREENLRLVEQLDTIQRSSSSSSKSRTAPAAPWQDHNRAAASQRRRDQEQERIARENKQLLKRLETSRPTYSRAKQLDDYRRAEAIGSRIGRYERSTSSQSSRSMPRAVAHTVPPSKKASAAPQSRLHSVSAYSALATDSDTESEDGWLAIVSAVQERCQPDGTDATMVEKEAEVKAQMDDAKKLRKVLGELPTVLKKAMKNSQGLGMASEDILTQIESAACDTASCTDALVQSWARSAVSELATFRDSDAFFQFQCSIHNQMTNDLHAVKDHAKAVYVLGKERRDARDRVLKLGSGPVDVGSEAAYKAAREARQAFTDIDANFADDFRSLREHYSSQLGLSLQLVLQQSADYFDGIAAAMRKAACFEDEPWYVTVDATTQKQSRKPSGASATSRSRGNSVGVHKYAIPHPPRQPPAASAAKRGKGGRTVSSADSATSHRSSNSTSMGSCEGSARPLYSKRSRETAVTRKQKSALSRGDGQSAEGSGLLPSSVVSGSTAYSTRTVDVDPSLYDTQQPRHRQDGTAVAVNDRLRTKPDPELPPPSPPKWDNNGVDVNSRLRVKPEPELPPQDTTQKDNTPIDDRLTVKPHHHAARAAAAPVTVVGVPMAAPADGDVGGGAGDVPLPEAEWADTAGMAACKTAGDENEADEVTTRAAAAAPASSTTSRPPVSEESRIRVRNQLLKKGFSDYLRVLTGDDTSEWGLHPKQ